MRARIISTELMRMVGFLDQGPVHNRPAGPGQTDVHQRSPRRTQRR